MLRGGATRLLQKAEAFSDGLGVLIDGLDESVDRVKNLLDRLKEDMINDRSFHPSPQGFNTVQLGTGGGQEHQAQRVLMLVKKRVNELGVVDPGIVQNPHDAIAVIVFLHRLEKRDRSRDDGAYFRIRAPFYNQKDRWIALE